MSKDSTRTDIPQVYIQQVNQTISADYDRLSTKDAMEAIQSLGLHELHGKRHKSVMHVVLSKILKSPEALAFKERYQREAQEGFTILLIGEIGVGKSSTVNTLFGKEVAKAARFRPETKLITPFEGTYHNVNYTIYNTPGLGEWHNYYKDVDEEYISLMKAQCPSPDVLWYVLRLDDNRVRAADAKFLELIHQNFGNAIWDRMMIVFTHSDKLESAREFQEFFEGRTKSVNEVIVEMTNREIKNIPAAAVANGHKQTPNRENWLGELFTTTFERINPQRLNAFLLAFAMDLEIPKSQSQKLKIQRLRAGSSKTAAKEPVKREKRIKLTEEQVERVKDKIS